MRLTALVLALLLGLPAQAATVLSVGDGDTLRVDDRGKRLTIRLACIDAPEMAQSPYGDQSRALSSDIRFWSSGDTKTGPPVGLLMGA